MEERILEQIREIMDEMTPTERQVLSARFGLEGAPMSRQEVAEKFGVSAERIRMVEHKAARRIRGCRWKRKGKEDGDPYF